MNRERRLGLFLLAAAVFVVLAAVAVVASRESNSLYCTMVFKDAQGLQAGDRVQLAGVDIGVVKWVKLNTQPTRIHVRIKIDPQYAPLVLQGSTAMIRAVSFPNVSGQRVIEVINPETTPPPPPLQREAIVQGVEGQVDLQMWKLKTQFPKAQGAISQALGAMSERIQDLNESVREFAASPRAREAVKDLREFITVMKEKGRQGLVYLQEKWPQVKAELAPVLKELEEFGRKHVVEELQQLIQQVDQTLEEWKREPAPSPTPTPV